mgnify:CR=1 FL=1
MHLSGTLAERVAPQSFDLIDYLLLLIQPEGGLTPFYRKVSAFEQEGEGAARGALANWYKERTDTKLNPDYAAMSEEQLKSSLINFLGPQSKWFIRSLHISLQWTDLGVTRPMTGRECDLGALRDALESKLASGERPELTREEVDRLRVEDLETDHFVHANGRYFVPTGKKLEYALTGDNLLKMMLVHVRVTAGLPVVVMGETGCGKTSLLKYLARAAGIDDDNFQVLNIHAGIGKPQIVAFVREAEKQAQRSGSQVLLRSHTPATLSCIIHVLCTSFSSQVWTFFDEANTSEELGIISEIVCSRMLQGTTVDPRLVFICAVNPYRERKHDIQVVGLASKLDLQDPMRKLVYRVHLLPEAMLDYVFDYGSSAPTEAQLEAGVVTDEHR